MSILKCYFSSSHMIFFQNGAHFVGFKNYCNQLIQKTDAWLFSSQLIKNLDCDYWQCVANFKVNTNTKHCYNTVYINCGGCLFSYLQVQGVLFSGEEWQLGDVEVLVEQAELVLVGEGEPGDYEGVIFILAPSDLRSGVHRKLDGQQEVVGVDQGDGR